MTAPDEDARLRALATAGGGGDTDAAEALVRAMHGPLYAFLHLLGIPDGDIDDVAQDAAVQVYRGLSRYDAAQPFLPWMRGVARHVAANYWRTRRRDRSRTGVFRQWLEGVAAEGDAAVVEAVAPRERLAACLERLPGRHREIVGLSYVDGLTSADVSQRLGMTAASVRQVLCRAREALRRCVEAAGAR